LWTPAPKESSATMPASRSVLLSKFNTRGFAAAFRRGVQRDAGLRLISVLLAVSLWVFVNAGQHGSLEAFNVPISYRGLPPHLIITNPHPQSVRIEVSGPRTLLSLIDPSRLTLRLDLIGVTVGQVSLRVNPEAFNVPRQTSVVGVAPSQIVLDIDQMVTRDLPVHLALNGAPAAGYHVLMQEATPRTISVRGPSKEFARVEMVQSEPIDLTGATANLAEPVALVMPFANARIDPAVVTANVTIGPIIEEREFRGMPIQVRGNENAFHVEPAHINLTLHGTQLALTKLNANELAYIDATGLIPGTYNPPVQVTLPQGIEVVHQSATKVKLRIYSQIRTSQH
jgi:YbbR domain-containing protein